MKKFFPQVSKSSFYNLKSTQNNTKNNLTVQLNLIN